MGEFNMLHRNPGLWGTFESDVIDTYEDGTISVDKLIALMELYGGTNIGFDVLARESIDGLNAVEIVTRYLSRECFKQKPIGRAAEDEANWENYHDELRWQWLELTKEFNWPWGFY